jgi:hypothetical protein
MSVRGQGEGLVSARLAVGMRMAGLYSKRSAGG